MAKAARYVISKDNFYNADNTLSNFYCTSFRAVAEEISRRKYFSGTLFIIDIKKNQIMEIIMVNGQLIMESHWYELN